MAELHTWRVGSRQRFDLGELTDRALLDMRITRAHDAGSPKSAALFKSISRITGKSRSAQPLFFGTYDALRFQLCPSNSSQRPS
jgi:hypothetical protein